MVLSILELVGTITVSDVDCEFRDEVGAWPFARVVPIEESACELGVTELEVAVVAVGGPLASELPIEDNASVLGVAELKLVLETLAELLVMSATSTELAVGEVETVEGSVSDTEGLAPEPACEYPLP